MTRFRLGVGLIAGALGLIAAAATAGVPRLDQRGASRPPLMLPSMAGRDLFEFYCASCHGRDGTGAGPTAPALRTAPADLTTLSSRNGGQFPRERLEEYITGARAVVAHGSRDMPVWGPIFTALDPSQSANRVRIANIVDHIASLQRHN